MQAVRLAAQTGESLMAVSSGGRPMDISVSQAACCSGHTCLHSLEPQAHRNPQCSCPQVHAGMAVQQRMCCSCWAAASTGAYLCGWVASLPEAGFVHALDRYAHADLHQADALKLLRHGSPDEVGNAEGGLLQHRPLAKNGCHQQEPCADKPTPG